MGQEFAFYANHKIFAAVTDISEIKTSINPAKKITVCPLLARCCCLSILEAQVCFFSSYHRKVLYTSPHTVIQDHPTHPYLDVMDGMGYGANTPNAVRMIPIQK